MDLNPFYSVMDDVIIYFELITYLVCAVSLSAFIPVRWCGNSWYHIVVFRMDDMISYYIVDVNFSDEL